MPVGMLLGVLVGLGLITTSLTTGAVRWVVGTASSSTTSATAPIADFIARYSPEGTRIPLEIVSVVLLIGLSALILGVARNYMLPVRVVGAAIAGLIASTTASAAVASAASAPPGSWLQLGVAAGAVIGGLVVVGEGMGIGSRMRESKG